MAEPTSTDQILAEQRRQNIVMNRSLEWQSQAATGFVDINHHVNYDNWAAPTEYGDPEDTREGLQYLSRTRPITPDSEIPYILDRINRRALDMESNGIHRAMQFDTRIGSGWSEVDNFARLKKNSEAVTDALLRGETPTPFYVASDVTNLRQYEDIHGMLLGKRIMRNIPYQISAAENNGLFDIRISPDGIAGDASDSMLVRLSKTQAREFLTKYIAPEGRFKESGGRFGLRESRAQWRRAAHDLAIGKARDIISDPKQLARYIAGGAIFSGKPKSSVQARLRKEQEKLINLALGDLRGNKNIRSILGLTYKRVLDYTGTKDTDRSLSLFKSEWSRIAEPALESLTNRTNWVANGAMDSTAMSIFNLPLLRSNKKAGGGISTLLLKTASDMQIQKENGAFRRMLNDNSDKQERNRIEEFARRIDQLEARQRRLDPSLARDGNLPSSSRYSAISREFDRWENHFLKKYNLAHPDNPLELHARLHIGYGTHGVGHGVYFTITQKGARGVTRRDPMVLQEFVPIVDEHGYFSSARGARFVGSSIILDSKSIVDSVATPWMNKAGVISQGFRFLVGTQHAIGSYADKFGVKTWGRGRDKTFEFSTQHALTASGDMHRFQAMKRLESGDRIAAQRELDKRILTATEEMKVATRTDSTQADWSTRRSVATPEAFYEDFYNLKKAHRKNVDVPKLLETYENLQKGILPSGLLGSHNSPEVIAYSKRKLDILSREISQVFEQFKTKRKLRRLSYDMQISALQSYIGSDTGLVAMSKLNRVMSTIERVPGLSFLGREAADNYRVFFDSVWRYAKAGGISSQRPMQLLKRINLPSTSDSIAGTRLWSITGVDLMDNPINTRNIHTLIPMSAQQIDENGNAIGEALDAETAMKLSGSYEQQTMVRPGIEKAIGLKNAHGLKLVFDTTKGTIVYAGVGNTIEFEDGPIQAIIGVDAGKLIGKHDQVGMFSRGWLHRIMTESGEDAAFAKEQLAELFGGTTSFTDIGANGAFAIETSAKRNRILPKLEELSSIWDAINERRIARGQEKMRQFESQIIRSSDGNRYRIDGAHLLTSTSVLDDSNPGTSLKGRKAGMYEGEFLPIGRGTRVGNLDAISLKRVRLAGAPEFSKVLQGAAFISKKKQGLYYRWSQWAGAFGATFGKKGKDGPGPALSFFEDQYGNARDITQNEIERRLTRAPEDMSLTDIEQRYGDEIMRLPLTMPVAVGGKTIDSIVLPAEMPKADNNVFQPSRVQNAADTVIRANSQLSLQPEDKALQKGLQRSVEFYHKELTDLGAGKTGLTEQLARVVEIKGQGIAQAKLGYNMQEGLTWEHVNALRAESGLEPVNKSGNVYNPGDTVVPREVAETMGVIEPSAGHGDLRRATNKDLASWRAMNEERGFFYGGMDRSPSVQQGGFLTRFVIDPLHGTSKAMKGDVKAYISEALRDPANADFDGDGARLIAAGFTGGVNPHRDGIDLQLMERQIEEAISLRNIEQAGREARKRALMDNQEAVTSDMIGRSLIAKELAKKDHGDYLNREELSSSELRNAERAVRIQQDTAGTQGLIGSITEAGQNWIMDKAFAANDNIERAMYEDLYSDFGRLREGVLKVKSKITIRAHDIRQGITGAGDIEADPAVFEKAVRDGFINTTSDPVAKAHYEQLIDFVHYMHAEHGPKWFDQITGALGPVKGAISGTGDYAIEKAISPIGQLFLHGTTNETGPHLEMLKFAQSYAKIDVARQQVAEEQKAAARAAKLAQLENAALDIESSLPHMDISTTPATSTPLEVQGPQMPWEVMEERGNAKMFAQHNQIINDMVNTINHNESVTRSMTAALEATAKKGNPWVGAAIGAGALAAGAIMFSGPKAGTSGSTHRIMSSKEQGYNVQVSADDDSSRSRRDYGSTTAEGLGGNVQVNISDNRQSLRDQQNQNTINAMKGR
jgi:hypothetical protein